MTNSDQTTLAILVAARELILRRELRDRRRRAQASDPIRAAELEVVAAAEKLTTLNPSTGRPFGLTVAIERLREARGK